MAAISTQRPAGGKYERGYLLFVAPYKLVEMDCRIESDNDNRGAGMTGEEVHEKSCKEFGIRDSGAN